MQQPNKHHYIPQFWTKNWTLDDNKAQRFTNPYRSIIASRRKHPAAIGWMAKLYEFPAQNQTTIDFETLLFRKIDQRASDLFSKMRDEADPKLDRTETETLGVFLLTLMHRSPAGIVAMRELSKLMFEEVKRDVRDRYQEFRKSGDPPTVEEYEAQAGPDDYLDHFSNIFRTVAFSERVAAFLAGLHWKRVELNVPDRRLLLSDDPLIRTNGLSGPEGHVAFPLSPNIAVIGCNQSEYFNTILSRSPHQLIGAMNVQTVESARHFVVDVDELQSKFITNRFGANPRPTLSEASLRDYGKKGYGTLPNTDTSAISLVNSSNPLKSD